MRKTDVIVRLLALVSLAACGSAALAGTPPQASGIESYLSYPFDSELTASRDGRQLAWVETIKGVRTVWTASAPSYRPRALTVGGTDDGQEIDALKFSPDGHVLVWTRGGGEAAGWTGHLPPPNPASEITQPSQEIWLSVDGGVPAFRVEGGEPIVSSSGRIAYLKDGQVWTVAASGSAPPEKLFYDRWRDTDLAWSPDGTRLAFVSHRGDHSFVGIYAGADRPLTWMAPFTSYDGDPVWSPDGRRIAFSRQFGLADYLNLPLVEKPNPFSLWVGNPDDGVAGKIYQSPATLDGSYPLIADGFNLMWGAGDRLSFRAEMDGWAHLYSIPAGGGAATLLTPGQFIVENVVKAPDGRSLLFSANSGSAPGDIDRRHVFRVAIDRPGPMALTPGTGLEWAPVPAGGSVAYITASGTTPVHVSLRSGAGDARPLATTPSDYDGRNAMVTPTPVTLTAADGMLVHGQLFTPAGGGKHPTLVFVHGGPGRQMLLGWSPVEYYTRSYAVNQYLAAHGYVVLSVNYRLGIGYGRAFQHAPHSGIAGNAEYQDVLAGARFLQARTDVDAGRIGIWGGSYGGLLTAQALARNSDIFKAGVDFHGVHDWSLFPGIADGARRYQPAANDALRIAYESSPEAAMAGWRSPVLLIAGDDDRNVPFAQTVDLARRLRDQGVPFEEVILPNEIHGFLRYQSWLTADTAMVDFLDRTLVHGKPASTATP